MLPTMRMLDNLRNTGSMMNNNWGYQPPKILTVSQLPLSKPILPTFLEPRNRSIIGRPDFDNSW
jgi:hypothetical protein